MAQMQTAKRRRRRGEGNEQTDDTGGNRTPPAKLRPACCNLGQGRLSWCRVRPMVTAAENSRSYRARQRDDDIVGPLCASRHLSNLEWPRLIAFDADAAMALRYIRRPVMHR